MEKSLTLSIPQPCHEKWQSFEPTTQGGFCSNCQKEVVDFTSWSDDDIKSYFKNRTQSTCGRFQPNQLKVYSLTEMHASPLPKWIPLSLIGFSLLLATQPSYAQAVKNSSSDSQEIKMGKVKQIPTQTTAPVHIHGTVKALQQPLAGVDVILKGTLNSTFTDEQGHFSIVIKNPSPSDVIVVSLSGYETKTLSVYNVTEMTIELTERYMLTGVVMPITDSPSQGGIWNRIKNLFR